MNPENPYRSSGIPTMEYVFVEESSGGNMDASLNIKVNQYAKEGFRVIHMKFNKYRVLVCMERLKS